jgi:CubicO group peptidase (beta-lactamase class C family)
MEPFVHARRTAVSLLLCLLPATLSPAAEWSLEQIDRLPQGEKPIRLFNGRDLSGWKGQTQKYFSVVDGTIVAKNGKEDTPKASTYLMTEKHYRNFRLIFESRLVTSEMHSGVALWGKPVERAGDPFSYQGHLVMYPSGYGFYDLYRRNSIFQDALGVARRAGRQHDWNQMEILATGRRIRHVINGQLVADWSDPNPELCEAGPIGLQLHSNTEPQEVRFRGLVLVENPADVLVTAVNRDAGLLLNGAPAESGMDAEALQKIGQRMREFVDANQIAGAVTLVARRGRVVHLDAAGHADIAEGRRMTTDALFAIASMTKPITAAAVMILVDEGKVKLDDPVSKYVPAFFQTALGSGKPAREVTLRDCLTHTSGLASDQRNQGTLANTVELLAKSTLAFEPGSKWQYGPGLSVAGRVVEVASGKPFDQFLQERIFAPLGMKETTFHPSAELAKRLARLYQPTADKLGLEPGSHWLVELSAETTPNPSGGLFSTALDQVRFHQMVLNGGQLDGQRILSSQAVAQMTSLQTGDLATGFTPGNGWGLGYCLVREPQGPTQALSAGSYGHGGAFGTQGWVDPSREMIFLLLIQRQNFGNGDGSDLRAEFQRLAVEAIRD